MEGDISHSSPQNKERKLKRLKANINVEDAIERLKSLKNVDEIAMISVAVIWAISEDKQTMQELASQLTERIKEEIEFNTRFDRRI